MEKNILNKIYMFSVVAKSESFTKAGEKLGISRSMISQDIKTLEKTLNIKLINRTTRSIRLTKDGEFFQQKSIEILSKYNDLVLEIKEKNESLEGTIKIAMQTNIAIEKINPLISEYQRQYPEVRFDIIMGDDLVDINVENIDVAFRIAPENVRFKGDEFYAKPLQALETVFAASPRYIDSINKKITPELLNNADWIYPSMIDFGDGIYIHKGSKHYKIKLNTTVRINSASGVLSLTTLGMGYSIFLKEFIKKELANNTLVQLLPEYKINNRTLYIMYPNKEYLPNRVSNFIDFIRKHYE